MYYIYKVLWDKRETDSLRGTVERTLRQSLFDRNFTGSLWLPLRLENMFPMKKYWTQYVSLKAHKGVFILPVSMYLLPQEAWRPFRRLHSTKDVDSFHLAHKNINSRHRAQRWLGHVLKTPQTICSSWGLLITKRVILWMLMFACCKGCSWRSNSEQC